MYSTAEYPFVLEDTTLQPLLGKRVEKPIPLGNPVFPFLNIPATPHHSHSSG